MFSKIDFNSAETKPVSIITVTFNAEKTLDRAIESVLGQDVALFDYYIIDGGSSDGTVDIIKKYEDNLAGWLSEKDSGIYDAMNKGITYSRGKWIYFLGADDVLAEGIIAKVLPYLTDDLSILYGNVQFDNGYLMKSSFSKRILLQNTIHHQSAFYRRSNFLHFKYDTRLKAISDYELNLKIYLEKKKGTYLPMIIAFCDTGGVSAELDTSLKETNQIRGKYIYNDICNKFLSAALQLYYLQKKIRLKLYGHRV